MIDGKIPGQKFIDRMVFELSEKDSFFADMKLVVL